MGLTILNGLMLASTLALVAIGLAIIFGLLRVVNLAHGELFIIGGYVVFAVHSAGASPWVGVLLAPLVVGAIGVVLDRGLLRHLYDRPLDTLVVTWGLSIALREILKLLFGADTKNVPVPVPGRVDLLGVAYPTYRLVLIATSAVVVAAVLVCFARTAFGAKVRAVVQNRDMAEAMGIASHRIDAVVFAVGAALAGLAGAMLTPLLGLRPEVGLFYLARSFLVVIIGGVGSLAGTVGGAAVIGTGEAGISHFTRPVLAQSLLFLAAIVLIRIRPQGLFSRRDVR
jgi:urea transport system permease protein